MLEGRRNDQKIMVKVVQKNPYAKNKKSSCGILYQARLYSTLLVIKSLLAQKAFVKAPQGK
jgi:hypothetical protein